MDSVSVMRALQEKTVALKHALQTVSAGAPALRVTADVMLVSVEKTVVR